MVWGGGGHLGRSDSGSKSTAWAPRWVQPHDARFANDCRRFDLPQRGRAWARQGPSGSTPGPSEPQTKLGVGAGGGGGGRCAQGGA